MSELGSLSWKGEILQGIRARNNRERDVFTSVFDAYQRALEEGNHLRSRNFQLEQQARRVGAFTSMGSSEDAETDRKVLEEKLSKLQHELTGSYRLQSENAQTLLRLKERAEQDETALLKKDDELVKCKLQIDELQDGREADEVKASQLGSTIDLLHKELQAARDQLGMYEAKASTLSQENTQLIERLLRIKDEQANHFNEMNSLVSSAQQKTDQKNEDVEIQAAVDLSDKSAILDAGAWRSYFNVTLPTEAKRTVRAHTGQGTFCRYNPKGTLVVTGGVDTNVKIWDSRSGTGLATLGGSKQPIMNVVFSHDDQYILAAGNDKVARVWSMKTSRVMHTLVGHSNKIYAAAFMPSDEFAVTGSHDMCVKVWELSQGTCVRSIPCRSSCNYLGLSPDGNMMATAHLDATVKLWSVSTGEEIHSCEGVHQSQATSVEFSQDGTQIVTNSRDHTIKLVDVRSFQVVRTMTGTKQDQYKNLTNWGRACISPDGQYASAGGADGSLFVWELGTGKLVTCLKATGRRLSAPNRTAKPSHTTCVDWNRNGKQMVTMDSEGSMNFWE